MWDQLDERRQFSAFKETDTGARRKAIQLGGDGTLLRLAWDNKEGGQYT